MYVNVKVLVVVSCVFFDKIGFVGFIDCFLEV